MKYLKKLFKAIYVSLFCWKSIDGKKWIEDSMSEKYGPDWLDQCMDALRDPSVRFELKKHLKLDNDHFKNGESDVITKCLNKMKRDDRY